jgi:hypothetical protein
MSGLQPGADNRGHRRHHRLRLPLAHRWVRGCAYWLMLGRAGTALLAVGVLILIEREAWDGLRADIRQWWLTGAPPP